MNYLQIQREMRRRALTWRLSVCGGAVGALLVIAANRIALMLS